MNHDDNDLILAYLDGTLQPADAARLNALLLSDADARARLRALAAADVRLRELAATRLQEQPQPTNGTTIPRRSWLSRILQRGVRLPAAAGVVFGVLCTSVVWAYVRTDAASTLKTLAPVVADGFEAGPAPGDGGVPEHLSQWGGDRAALVPATDSIAPRSGMHMLQMLRSDFVGEKSTVSHVGDQMQLIDLAAHRDAIATGRIVVRAEAWFNQVPPPDGQEFACGIQLFAFGYDPRVHRGKLWKAWLYDDHLSFSGQQQERTDPDPATWEKVVATLNLPPATRFLIVHVRVNRIRPDPTAQPVEFRGAFIDDVKAELLLRPASGAISAEVSAQ